MFKCDKCGQDVYALINGLCGVCIGRLSYSFNYRYKCTCGGEFNEPAIMENENYTGIPGKAKCPFCGRRMFGLN